MSPHHTSPFRFGQDWRNATMGLIDINRTAAARPATDLAELMAQAAQQHGLVRAMDSPDPDAARKRLDRMRRRGLVGLIGRGVYRVEGSSDTWHQRALSAAWLVSPMALLSHRAALALWGLSSRRGVEVLVPVSRGGRPASVRVHQTRFLTAVDVDSRDRVPVTSIERTLVDAAAITPMGGLARLLDAAVEAGLATPQNVVEHVRTMPTRGRKGMPILRVLLEERLGFPADEDQSLRSSHGAIIIRSDLPEPRRQHPLDINGRPLLPRFRLPGVQGGHRVRRDARSWVAELRRPTTSEDRTTSSSPGGT